MKLPSSWDWDWAILYEDETWFTSNDGPHWIAPRTGVMGILQKDPNVGVATLYSDDGWWVWRKDRWLRVDRYGKDDYRRSYMEPDLCILEGRMVHNDEWQEILDILLKAEQKKLFYIHERR